MIPKIQKLINNTKAIFKVDSESTKGSNDLVTSGGVYKTFKSDCGSNFVWEPIEEAPFTKIEARYGVGSTSWVWAIFTE